MSNEADFNALLDKPAEDFKPPVAMPVGTYTFQVANREYGKTPAKPDGKGNTPYIEFSLAPVAAHPDVDEALLAEHVGDKPLNAKVRKETFYLTEDSAYRLTDPETGFAAMCGVEVRGKTTREVIEACLNQQVIGYATQTPNQKNPSGNPYVNLGNWAKVS